MLGRDGKVLECSVRRPRSPTNDVNGWASWKPAGTVDSRCIHDTRCHGQAIVGFRRNLKDWSEMACSTKAPFTITPEQINPS